MNEVRQEARLNEMIDAAIARGMLLLERGETPEAEHSLQRAVSLADELGTSRDGAVARISSRRALAAMHRKQGRYRHAEKILQDALAGAARQLSEDDRQIVPLLNELGIVYKYSGNFAAARDVYQRALLLLKSAHGEAHEDVASLYHNLGGLAHAEGDFDAAEPLARRAITIRVRVLGPDHPDVAADRTALAPILDALGRHDEAELVLQQALLAYVRCGNKYEAAVTKHNLGAVAFRRHDLALARERLAEALVIKEEILGRDHPELAATLNNLGRVHQAQGKIAAARGYYRRAIANLEHCVEPSHPTLELCRERLREMSGDKPVP